MRVALVSGANRGIGLAIAREVKAAGYALSLGVRNPQSVPADLLGPQTQVSVYDAATAGEAAWVDAAFDRFGRIDALVNNAGIAPFVGFEEGTDEDLDALLEVNVKAPFRLVRAALPHLKSAGTGRVVTVASLSGKRVLGLNAGYQMAKHAAVALSHATRRIGWEHGIRATALCPGYVDTDLTAGVDFPREEMSRPEDLARLVVTVLQLPNSASVAELLVNCRFEPML